MLKLTILQTSLCFLIPPIILCCKLKRHNGIIILGINVLISLLVHRVNRKEEKEFLDYCDIVCISLWVLYNTVLVIEIFMYLNKEWNIIICILLLLGVCGAILTYHFNIKRKQIGTWRSNNQNMIHILMHMSGGIGSVCILLAIKQIDKK